MYFTVDNKRDNNVLTPCTFSETLTASCPENIDYKFSDWQNSMIKRYYLQFVTIVSCNVCQWEGQYTMNIIYTIEEPQL